MSASSPEDANRTASHVATDPSGPITPVSEDSLELRQSTADPSGPIAPAAETAIKRSESHATASGPLVIADESGGLRTAHDSRGKGFAPAPEIPEIPVIPGYAVDRVLAHGGMGMVFAARDISLNRDVAIKVLLPGAHIADAAERFILESKITARLPHPAIPPVYQLGTLADGNPFLAMKLIRGRTLAEELKLGTFPAALPHFVQIFEQIAQAVGFAHSQGIIHRDLKPSNVMVGAFGEVQVMDWGLAKEVRNPDRETASFFLPLSASGEQTPELTQTGYVMGTVAYMAPEQARGEPLGPPADVFALGGILGEILTRRPPFNGRTFQETHRRAAAGDVSAICSHLDSCGADAELIALCKHFLSPEVNERPADGKAVAGAIAAYRAGVEQRLRDAETQRVAAEARIIEQRKRRRVQLALMGAVALLFAVGGVFAWWKSESDARNARSETARLAADAETERQKRDVQERLIRNRDAIASLLARLEPELRTGNAERAEELLSQVEKRIVEGGADDLESQFAHFRREFNTLKELDRLDNARWALVNGQVAEWKEIAPQFAKVFSDYGIKPGGRPGEAIQRLNASLIRTRLLTSLEIWFVADGRSTGLRAILSAADPDDFRNQARLTSYQLAAVAWAFRGKKPPTQQPVWFAVAHGDDSKADRDSRQRLLESAYRMAPTSFPLLMTLGSVADRDNREGALVTAGWYRAAIAIQPRSAAAWNNLGNSLRSLRNPSDAIAALRMAISLDPKLPHAHSNLGNSLRDLGDIRGAIAAANEAIRLDPTNYKFHTNLGVILSDSGDVRGAIAAFNAALRINPQDEKALNNLGNDLRQTGDLPGALAALREAIRLKPNDAKVHTNLGTALESAGDRVGAIASYKEAIRLDPTISGTHANLGDALRLAKDFPGAIAACKEAIRLDPKNTGAYVNLGLALKDSGDVPGAIATYHTALAINPNRTEARLNLSLAYLEQKRYPEAIASARETIRLNPKYPNGHAALGLALRASGDIPAAKAAFLEAARLNPKQFEPLYRRIFPSEIAPPPRDVRPEQ
ncbi:MAG: tetratricopeptide repeat protein [Planctomycetes bacterium]|nr:tetratricopeptide repeat protein [Planctomycetota bacterium]